MCCAAVEVSELICDMNDRIISDFSAPTCSLRIWSNLSLTYSFGSAHHSFTAFATCAACWRATAASCFSLIPHRFSTAAATFDASCWCCWRRWPRCSA